jgi:hypothetical protein
MIPKVHREVAKCEYSVQRLLKDEVNLYKQMQGPRVLENCWGGGGGGGKVLGSGSGSCENRGAASLSILLGIGKAPGGKMRP